MSYRIRKNKNLDKQARGLLLEQTKKALTFLDRYEEDAAASVHGARQCFKRCRSLLHLIRDADSYIYAIENRFFRDAGRALSGSRDDQAMLETLETLKESHQHIYGEELRLLRKLVDEILEQKVAYKHSGDSAAVYRILGELQTETRHLRLLKFQGVTRDSVLKQLEKSRQAIRYCYRTVCTRETSDAYHSWRKAVKRLENQLQLCASFTEDSDEDYREGLKVLAETLGHHQDITILKNRISQHRTAGSGNSDHQWVLVMLDVCQRQQRELAKEQMQALMAGQSDIPKLHAMQAGQLRVI